MGIIIYIMAIIGASVPSGIGLKFGEHIYRRMLKEYVEHLIIRIKGEDKI